MGPPGQFVRVQFSLRMLFLMTTTCAAAFALMAHEGQGVLSLLAGCVPAFWFGVACMIAADVLALGNRRATRYPAAMLVGLGMAILCGSAIIALHLLPFVVLRILFGPHSGA